MITRRSLFATGAAVFGSAVVLGAGTAQAAETRPVTEAAGFRTSDADGGEASNPANRLGCALGRGVEG
ncbi:hypothetical protein ACFSBV_09325 [Brevibacterium otitidis]